MATGRMTRRTKSEPRSLLRKLLNRVSPGNQNAEQNSSQHTGEQVAQNTGYRIDSQHDTRPELQPELHVDLSAVFPPVSLNIAPQSADLSSELRSPVRPNIRMTDTVPQVPLAILQDPTSPAHGTLEIPQQIVNIEDRLRAETVLEHLREKTAQTAQEYAEGKLNRAQFNALYGQYNEKRAIIEKLLANDPDSQAWQRVAMPGHTGFLRDHFEARALTFTLAYFEQAGMIGPPFYQLNDTKIPFALLDGLIEELENTPRTDYATRYPQLVAGRQDRDGKWLSALLGTSCVTFVLFSLEPSATQVNLARDLHADFERANLAVLERKGRNADQLVIPQRALFTASVK